MTSNNSRQQKNSSQVHLSRAIDLMYKMNYNWPNILSYQDNTLLHSSWSIQIQENNTHLRKIGTKEEKCHKDFQMTKQQNFQFKSKKKKTPKIAQEVTTITITTTTRSKAITKIKAKGKNIKKINTLIHCNFFTLIHAKPIQPPFIGFKSNQKL